MIFEMYKGNSTTPADTDLVGICEISDLDDDGNKIQTIPGYSELRGDRFFNRQFCANFNHTQFLSVPRRRDCGFC